MKKVQGTIRIWNADAGTGIFDSSETPGGCFAESVEMLPTETPLPMNSGAPVRFNWSESDELIVGCQYRAYSWYPIDESLSLDEDDYELLDLEEPIIDDDEELPDWATK